MVTPSEALANIADRADWLDVYDQVTPHGAAVVLHQLNGHQPGLTYPAGDFTRKLIDAACQADPDNLRKLRRVFPDVCGAVFLYKQHDDGVALLLAKLGVE